MSDTRIDRLLDLLVRLDNAVMNEGQHPEHHAWQIDRLRHEWPPLWDAIEGIRKWMRNQ